MKLQVLLTTIPATLYIYNRGLKAASLIYICLSSLLSDRIIYHMDLRKEVHDIGYINNALYQQRESDHILYFKHIFVVI